MKRKTDTKAEHLATGSSGEVYAAAYLVRQGMKLLQRNWRPFASSRVVAHGLELDIVARDADTLVFVEVKTRRLNPGVSFTPQDSFTTAKRGRLLKAAGFYLNEFAAWSQPCRFDLLCVIIRPDSTCTLEHYKNVLTFSAQGRGALGSGNASWQPW